MNTESIQIPIIAILPFVLMLLSIALFPLFWNHFWEKNKNKLIIAIILSIPVIIYLLLSGLTERLLDTLIFDYVPFIILLGSLFTITGGIFLSGDIEAKQNQLLIYYFWQLVQSWHRLSVRQALQCF
jgi:hypothetical protein